MLQFASRAGMRARGHAGGGALARASCQIPSRQFFYHFSLVDFGKAAVRFTDSSSLPLLAAGRPLRASVRRGLHGGTDRVLRLYAALVPV
jgi:hypothetical protein